MSPSDRPDQPRNGAGSAALVSGIVAVIFAVVPVVGEFVALPAALAAIVLGGIGLGRIDKGTATNLTETLTGMILGVLSGLIIFLIIIATADIG